MTVICAIAASLTPRSFSSGMKSSGMWVSRQVGTAEYPQYLGVVSATIGANAVLADYTLTPGVWRIVAAAWRDNREYGYIAVQVGGTEHGGGP